MMNIFRSDTITKEPGASDFKLTKLQPSRWFRLKLTYRVYERLLVANLMTTVARMTGMHLPIVNFLTPSVLIVVIVISSLVYGPNMYGKYRLLQIRQSINEAAVFSSAMQKKSAQDLDTPGYSQMGLSTMSDASLNATREMALIEPAGMPNLEYNYTKNTSRTIFGPAMGQCSDYDTYYSLGIGGYTSTSISLVTSDSEYLSATIISTDADELITYTASANDRLVEYRGGEFAIQYIYSNSNQEIMPMVDLGSSEADEKTALDMATDESIGVALPDDGTMEEEMSSDSGIGTAVPGSTEPMIIVDEPVSSENQAKLVGAETIDGVEYYIFEDETFVYCGGTDLVYTEIGELNGVTRYWVSSQTEEIYKEQLYLGSFDKSNLIVEFMNTSEAQNTDVATKLNDFEFGYNVPLQTISDQVDQNTTTEFLTSTEISVLLPNQSLWELTSAYSQQAEMAKNARQPFYQRNFYADTELGQKLYDQQIQTFQQGNEGYLYAMLELSFNGRAHEERYIAASIFDPTVTKDSVLERTFGTSEAYQVVPVSLTIEGETVGAELYDFTRATISSRPAEMDPSVDPMPVDFVTDEFEYRSIAIYIVQDGYHQLFQLSGTAGEIDEIISSLQPMSLLNTTSEEGRQGIVDLVTQI